MDSLPLSHFENHLLEIAWRPQVNHAATVEFFARMVLHGPDDSTQLLVDVLKGHHGGLLGALAYRSLETGMHIDNGNPLDAANPVVTPFAEVCMFKGRQGLAMLEAVLDISPRDSSTQTRSLSKSDYLDYLCTTAQGRENDPSAFEDGRLEGLVGLAAQNWDLCLHARTALDMAWDINPEHHAWDHYIHDQSGPGAFVREYLMNRKLAATGPGAEAPGANPERRRAARAL